MSDEYPQYFYKYRAINSDLISKSELEKDYAIDALFNNHAVFSSRKNFNDLFDSKIDFVKPTPKQFKELRCLVNKNRRQEFERCIDKGIFTEYGHSLIERLVMESNKLFDAYPILSLSKNSKSNLMWAHYSDSHQGFCIEFKSQYMKADKVEYHGVIQQVKLLDMVRMYFGDPDGEKLSKDIWKALLTKLNEWKYEEEYRFIGGDSMGGGRIQNGEKILKFPYVTEAVESIIFGCRMDDKVKKYIAQNLPYKVKLKQAVAGMSSIEIIDSNFTLAARQESSSPQKR